MDSGEELDSENAENELPANYAAKKRIRIVLMLMHSAIIGVATCFLPDEETPLDVALSLPIVILAISWCFVDAAERGHRIGRLTKLLLMLLFLVGYPAYLFQTRGVGALKTLALTMALVCVMFLCMAVTSVTTLYVGEVVGLWEAGF